MAMAALLRAGKAASLMPRLGALGARAMSAPTVYEKMVYLTAVDPEGHRHAIRGLIGRTLAETLKASPELGSAPIYCQSLEGHWDCHVKVAQEWLAKMSSLSPAEQRTLEQHAEDVSDASRLGTQMVLGPELNDMVVAIAPLQPWQTL